MLAAEDRAALGSDGRGGGHQREQADLEGAFHHAAWATACFESFRAPSSWS